MSLPKTSVYFSVVIPCLNEEEYLPRLLHNLSRQTYRHFEVYVVDGSSEDNTPSLVTDYPANYPLKLITTTKRNVSYQRNLGAHQSSGPVLVFFDADTQIPKNFLEKIHHAFETKRPHLLTTWMAADSHRAADQLVATGSNLLIEIGRIVGVVGSFGAMIAIKRGVFDDIGGFDEQTKFSEDRQIVQTAVDYNYQFIILQKPKFIYSLRRFRSEGTLEALLDSIRANLEIASNGFHTEKINYPMGGQAFASPAKIPPSLRWTTKLLTKLKKTTKEQQQTIRRLTDFFQFR